MALRTAAAAFSLLFGAASAQLPPSNCPPTNNPQIISSSDNPSTLTFNQTHYTKGLDCGWVFKNEMQCDSDNPIVKLVWQNIDTEYWYDYVVVWDGDSMTDKTLGRYSGNAVTDKAIMSSGPAMFLQFHSDMDKDGSHGFQGFELQYTFECGPMRPSSWDHCRPWPEPIELTESGTLEFTRDDYDHNMDCAWLLKNTDPNCEDPRVQYEFTKFSTEFSYDYITVYTKGEHDDKQVAGRYTGPQLFDGPGYHYSDHSEVLFTFHSDRGNNQGSYEGFTVDYKMVCGKPEHKNCPSEENPLVITPTDTNPGFLVFSAEDYLNKLDCHWVLNNTNTTCKQGAIVSLDFPHFHTEEVHDFLQIFDGEDARLGSWSGTRDDQGPGFQKSTKPTMRVQFTTDRNLASETYEGFTMQYHFLCQEDLPVVPQTCPPQNAPKAVTGNEFKFESQHYENNLDCGFVITNNQSVCENGGTPVVGLDFTKFKTEAVFDYVTLYDGDKIDEEKVIGSFSGSASWEVPLYQRSISDSMYIAFHSDGSIGATHPDDALLAAISYECCNDPIPKATWDCSEDNNKNYIQATTNGQELNPEVQYGHYTLPFSVGFPIMIEQYYTEPNPQSLLSGRGRDGVMGEVAFALDYMADAEVMPTSFCCGALNNETANSVAGKIAVCDRGSCLFVTKSQVVQDHGAIGLIVVDYNEDGVRMGSTVPVDTIIIPSVSVRHSYGQMLRLVGNQTSVFVKMAAFRCDDETFSGFEDGSCGGLPSLVDVIKPTPRPTTGPTVPTARSTDTPTGRTTGRGEGRATSRPTSSSRTATPTLAGRGTPRPTVRPSLRPRPPATLRPTQQPTTQPQSAVSPTPIPDARKLQVTLLVNRNFDELENDKFIMEVHAFFDWPDGAAEFAQSPRPATDNKEQTEVVLQVSDVPGLTADKAVEKAQKKLSQQSSESALVSSLSLGAQGPIQCANVACEANDFVAAEIDYATCECNRPFTGLGTFVYIVLPIFVGLALLALVCFLCPGCLLYKNRDKQMFGGVRSDDFDGPEEFGDVEGGEGTGFVMDTRGSANKIKAEPNEQKAGLIGNRDRASEASVSHFETADVALVSLQPKEDTNPVGDTLQDPAESSSSDDDEAAI